MIDDALLPLLPSLVALMEERSVTRAAARLRISQPRMSARLAELRALVGDPLLVSASRTRGLLPTARGEELARAVKVGLTELGGAFASAPFDPATSTRTFKIMANENATIMVGGPLMRAVRQLGGSNIRIVFFAHDAERLAGLEDGTLDLALARPYQLTDRPALVTRIVVRDSFYTLAPISEGLTELTLDTFCSRPHIAISDSGGEVQGIPDLELAKLGRRREVALSVQSHLLAIEMVAVTGFLATVPKALVEGRSTLLSLLEPPLPFDPFVVTAAWHPRVANDRAHQWLRRVLFNGLRAADAVAGAVPGERIGRDAEASAF